MKNMYKRIKIFSALFLILFVSTVIVTNARMAMADSVAIEQGQTTMEPGAPEPLATQAVHSSGP